MKTQKIQQILIMLTEDDSLRSQAVGWTAESPPPSRTIETMDCHVGLIPSNMHEVPTYDTVVHALTDEWRLLSPPTAIEHRDEEGGRSLYHEWWLTRIVEK